MRYDFNLQNNKNMKDLWGTGVVSAKDTLALKLEMNFKC